MHAPHITAFFDELEKIGMSVDPSPPKIRPNAGKPSKSVNAKSWQKAQKNKPPKAQAVGSPAQKQAPQPAKKLKGRPPTKREGRDSWEQPDGFKDFGKERKPRFLFSSVVPKKRHQPVAAHEAVHVIHQGGR